MISLTNITGFQHFKTKNRRSRNNNKNVKMGPQVRMPQSPRKGAAGAKTADTKNKVLFTEIVPRIKISYLLPVFEHIKNSSTLYPACFATRHLIKRK